MCGVGSLDGSQEDRYLYKLIMRDSGGDGWSGAEYTITTESETVFSGTLVDGATGVVYMCIEDGSHTFVIEERYAGVGGGP